MDNGKVILDGRPRDIFDSEQARLTGIGIPKATKLYQALKEWGISLPWVPITSEEATQLLKEVLKLD